jgi:hypothetical protein
VRGRSINTRCACISWTQHASAWIVPRPTDTGPATHPPECGCQISYTAVVTNFGGLERREHGHRKVKVFLTARFLAMIRLTLANDFYDFNSTVVIWSSHIGSYEGHAPLLGKDLRKDLVHRGTLG